MPNQGVVLDPAGFAPDRVELSLTELGLELAQEGADFGESQIEVQEVRQEIGSTISDRHLEPVEMTIPLILKPDATINFAEALQKLEAKYGLFQREGGWILRTFSEDGGFAGAVGYQVLKASLSGLQGWAMEHRQFANAVTLKVLRSPLCYSTEEAESEVFEETTKPELIATLDGGKGTAEGLLRLRVENKNEDGDWSGLIGAIESRDYPGASTADTTAALAYAAVDLTPKGESKEATRSGVEVVRNEALNAGWQTLLDSEVDGVGHMTHLGTRRVWLRIFDPSDEAGEVELRLLWRPLGTLSWSENGIIPTPLVGGWALIDMDECRPQAAVIGDERWEAQVQGRALSGSGTIDIARFYPLPTEQYLRCSISEVTEAAEASVQKAPGEFENDTSTGSVDWSNLEYAKASDNSRATAALPALDTSRYLKGTHLGFAVPEDATVVGIGVSVERSADAETLVLETLRLVVGGEIMSGARSSATHLLETDQVGIFGGADDLWGVEGLTPALLNATGFGVVYSAKNKVIFGERTIGVDQITLTVYYTEAADENRICFAGRSIELRSNGVYRQHPSEEVWGPVVPDGFLPYAPPPGLEQRKARIIVIPTQGDLAEAADAGSNDLSLQAMTRDAFYFAPAAAA